MAKKRSWFNLVKKFFIPDTQSNQDKKDKRRKWVFFGRLKVKSRLPSIAAPSPPRERRTATRSEAEEQQSIRALDVALATAAAAEAAVAAAHAAAEVVLLTGVPNESKQQQQSAIKLQPEAHIINFTHHCEKDSQETAATKIQTAFRGYLARKALNALKGIVKLQAIIRGRNVRRQAMNTLKCLQSIVNIQSQVSAKKIQMGEGNCYFDENKQFQYLTDKIIKMDTNSQKRWDGSILTKEEAEALFLSKKEAAIKRERIKEYCYNHRNSAETERSKANGRWRYWLEQWVDTQLSKSKELEDLDTVLTSMPKPRVEYRGKQLKLRPYNTDQGLDSPITAASRKSFHRKQCSLGEDNSFSSSPIVPTYMAATESAKAKTRSLSSPKLRPPGNYDAYSDGYSPCKNKLSLKSSAATELASSGKFERPSQRSPSLKNLPGPVKSNRTLVNVSFDSECSLRTWDQQRAL
ncbi:protein IQ-DOMAIN 11 isoform X2 [Mercurialis annua]|uniref:protein IQ-DOMAIN 11 isoform X2 n=1 Tax=Mercurialis annua TaxID=3986 RepID=UPI00215FCCDF|nr:protein IQ-DOMAIN 11 isoform X2 [Mercurialis annua]